MIPRRLIRSCRALTADQRGNLAVELGLVSMFLMLMLLGLFHYAGIIQQGLQLRQAARAGVEYAISYPSDTTGIQQVVTNSSNMDTTGMTVTVDQFCECPDGTSVSCTGTCASGLLGNGFVRVVVKQPERGFLEAFNPASLVEGRAVIRVR